MTAQVLQEQVGPQPTGGTSTTVLSTALASNATVGSTIEAWVLWGGSTAPTSVQDGASQTYTLQVSFHSVGLGATLSLYTLVNNQSATKLQVTATWAAAQSFRTCWVKEIGGVPSSSPVQGTPVINEQVNPGTTANAITSGNVTPSPVPALLSSFSLGSAPGANMTGGTTNSPIAGANSSGNWGGAWRAAGESYHLTSGSAIAATYGNTGGNSAIFMTGAVLYTEIYPPPGQQLL